MAALEFEAYGPKGDSTKHRSLVEIIAGFEALPPPPKDRGRLSLIVRRYPDGHREILSSTRLTPEEGVPGDGWNRRPPRKIDAQLAVIRIDIAELLAGEQSVTLVGDQLFVDLNISSENLPTGTRLRVGNAEVEMTPEPHNGCLKFKDRFGQEALDFVNAKATRDQNRRGVYWKVVKAGEITDGCPIEVLSRTESNRLF
jgi:hypothetical protein